jgi:hypothetical protein
MGKGGVGKSTVAAALGSLAAARGLRTIVAEVALRRDISRTLGTDPEVARAPETEVELRPGLFWISIDPHRAMEEYLVDQMRVRALAEALSASRAFNYLAAAAPGLQELLTVGKLWELSQRERRIPGTKPYDLVVVDAPATGHGLAYLTTPSSFADIARAGPIARQARTIHEMLADGRQTGVVAVTTPHELPVTEALFLHVELRRRMGLDLDRVVVNALAPARFSPRDLERLRAALAPGEETPSPEPEPSDHWSPVQAGIRAALSQADQARDQRRQVDRLRRGTGRPPAALPFLYSATLGSEELALLADRLEGAL